MAQAARSASHGGQPGLSYPCHSLGNECGGHSVQVISEISPVSVEYLRARNQNPQPIFTKPSHGLPVELACLGVVSLLLEVEHLHAQGGVLDCCLVLLWPVKLALLLETRACVALTQGAQCLVRTCEGRCW